jgi:hypothetical protein
LLARSSVLVVLLAGCDLVFGVNGQPEPCELGTFDGNPHELFAADTFSVDWDQTFAVIQKDGYNYEAKLPELTLTPVDVGIYMNVYYALAPEGDSLFYTIAVEPFELKGAVRNGAVWRLGATVPRGTIAGTPSADVFGPRRVMVRMRMTTTDVQEYLVDDNGVWKPHGASFELAAATTVNLTPNGLTMVWSGSDATGVEGVFAASRDTVDSPFGTPMLLRAGVLREPQLCGKCRQLYAIGDYNVVQRFDR